MKKILNTIALVSVATLFAGCQKELTGPGADDSGNKESKDIVITASRPETRVSYAEDGTTHNLVASWTSDDVVFGFTSSGTPVSFTVASVDATTGVATLNQTTSVTITEGMTIHAIHCPGKTMSDLDGMTLPVDFSEQSANVIPVLLLSTATVSGNALTFTFDNAVSIIGIKNPVFPKATSADKLINITLSGHEIVSSGVVSVSGGQLIFTGNAPDKFIKKIVNATPVVSGEQFTINDPVYIVVPAGPIATVSAIDNRNNFFVYSLNRTADVSKYYGLSNKTFTAISLPTSTNVSAGGVEWARANLGGSGVTDMGDIYRWSDTGKIYTERSGTTSVSFDANHQDGFFTYEGECYYTANPSAKYTKYTTADGKLVLDPVDDVVQLTYPGTGWRMPTLADFNALFELAVTYNSGSGNNVGTTVTQGENTVFFRGTAQVCAPSSTDHTSISKRGRYWASTIAAANLTSTGGNPDFIQFNGSDGRKANAPSASVAYRHSGYLIRPVKE